LDKYRDGAIQAKRKRDLIDRAMKIVEDKHHTINTLLGSKEMKQVFEKKFGENKFGFNY
jgi:hypothetical protein